MPWAANVVCMEKERHVKKIPTADEAPRPAAEKRKWVDPKVTEITAGSAELNVGAVDDGVDKS